MSDSKIDLNNIKFDQEDIDRFNNCFKEKSLFESGWRIKINGIFVRLASGKALWSTKSHAYLALTNHLYGNSRIKRELNLKYFKTEYLSYKFDIKEKDFMRHFIDFLEESGIVEFIELK